MQAELRVRDHLSTQDGHGAKQWRDHTKDDSKLTLMKYKASWVYLKLNYLKFDQIYRKEK